MSIRIFRDVEEAISREIRRITFFDDRSVNPHTVLQDTFDPFTGEIVKLAIEPDFYDSSADTKMIQYPHFFVKLLRSKEDLTTGRVIPEYGKVINTSITTSPKAFQVKLYQSDGVIAAPGNTITTTALKIRTVSPGDLLRLLDGNNKGTYRVNTVVPSDVGPHTITVTNTLLDNLPALFFDSVNRFVVFTTPVDLNTIKPGDIFTDSGSNAFNIVSIDINNRKIEIDGATAPVLTAGATVTRSGDVFQLADPSLVTFMVMDPTKPVQGVGMPSNCDNYSAQTAIDPPVPLDLYYLVRIDSKERDTHIDVANRMWEEFNPPRTGLPTVIRKKVSAEQQLTADVLTGGSDTITVKDNSKFNLNDPVFIFDDLTPTKAVDGRGFQSVFSAKVKALIGTTQIQLDSTVPDSFTIANNARIVSNAEYRIHMFHFVDHVTKDVEGAQYWVHEYTFWVQVWVDRQGEPVSYDGVVQAIGISGEDIDGNVIIEC